MYILDTARANSMKNKVDCAGTVLLFLTLAVAPLLAGCGDFWQAPTGSTVTTTTVAASPTSVVEGASVTLTATVSPSTATGTVTFYNGTAKLGTGALSSGTATYSATFSTSGSQSITASYGGDTNDAASTSSAVVVNVALPTLQSTDISLTSSNNSPSTGANITLTATVTPSGATGNVNFDDTTTTPAVLLGTSALNSGIATLQTSFTTTGTHTITATYVGSTTYSTSTTPTPLSINVQ